MIDWSDPYSKISKYFTVKEALYLPSWNCMHTPSDEEKDNIIRHAQNMDKIRELLDSPLRVHCWIRPVLNNQESEYNGQDYNLLVHGAPNSRHKHGDATDYDAIKLSCDQAREILTPKLEEFGMRMEDAPGTPWVHNDSGPVITTRLFKP